ncbi:MAG: polymer-forming cytoskeletal protein [Bacteroidetes bacterium]|nr:polymer-forming cytoskeletal protein [Bacteroidota bacterium]
MNHIVNGTEINGDLVSDANVLIDGEMNGNISCSGKVIIGSGGKIKGNLVCVNAEIQGSIDGEVTVEGLLTLTSTARIKGDIQTAKLVIQEGAIFEGSCVMKSPTTPTTFTADVKMDD